MLATARGADAIASQKSIWESSDHTPSWHSLFVASSAINCTDRRRREETPMSTPTGPRWGFNSYVEALPPIVAFLVDLVVGVVVFGSLAWVSTLIHDLWGYSKAHGLDSNQLLALNIVEETLFWLDVVFVTIYAILRSVTHVIRLVRAETSKWRTP